MKSPKLLPWLARQAGLTEKDVELLWSSALRHAGLGRSQLTENQRLAAAMQELLARLAHETRTANFPQPSTSLTAQDAGRPMAIPA